MTVRIHDAYFAGLFDGEGSVSILTVTRKNSSGYRLRVAIKMIDINVLNAFLDRFGGAIVEHTPKHEGWSVSYEWRLGGAAAKPFLEAIQPFCIAKAPHIVLALKYIDTLADKHNGGNSNAFKNSNINEIRGQMCNEMRSMNIKSPYKQET